MPQNKGVKLQQHGAGDAECKVASDEKRDDTVDVIMESGLKVGQRVVVFFELEEASTGTCGVIVKVSDTGRVKVKFDDQEPTWLANEDAKCLALTEPVFLSWEQAPVSKGLYKELHSTVLETYCKTTWSPVDEEMVESFDELAKYLGDRHRETIGKWTVASLRRHILRCRAKKAHLACQRDCKKYTGYDNGTLEKISQKKFLSPVALARAVINMKLKTPGKKGGGGKHAVKTVLRTIVPKPPAVPVTEQQAAQNIAAKIRKKNKNSRLTANDVLQVIWASQNDCIHPVYDDGTKDRASEYEEQIGARLRALGIDLVDEAVMKGWRKTAKNPSGLTPDFLLKTPTYINGKRVNWIDAKMFFATDLDCYDLAQVTKKYTAAFGPGAFCFSQNWVQGVDTKAKSVCLHGSPETFDAIQIVDGVHAETPTKTVKPRGWECEACTFMDAPASVLEFEPPMLMIHPLCTTCHPTTDVASPPRSRAKRAGKVHRKASRRHQAGIWRIWKGEWITSKQDVLTIHEGTVSWADGSGDRFEATSSTACRLWWHGSVYKGVLVNGKIMWTDGDVWTQVPEGIDSSMVQDPDIANAMQMEAPRQKLFVRVSPANLARIPEAPRLQRARSG